MTLSLLFTRFSQNLCAFPTRLRLWLPAWLLLLLLFTLGSIWSRGISKIRSITKKVQNKLEWPATSSAKQSWSRTALKRWINTLNRWKRKLPSIGNPSTKTTEKRNCWIINRAECFHRNRLKYVATSQRSILSCLTSCCKLSYRALLLLLLLLLFAHQHKAVSVKIEAKQIKKWLQQLFHSVAIVWWKETAFPLAQQ